MKLQHSEHTDVGRVRSVNQDSLGIKAFPDQDTALYVVADGMGGHQGGEVASQAAVDTILETFKLDESSDITTNLKDSFHQANQSIIKLSEGRTMGTTGVALVFFRNLAFLANVGDSRAYVVRDGELRQVTLDHSLVEEQVRAGLLTKEQAKISTIKNIVTRALGNETDFRADIFCEPAQLNDVFLLCSDGLHGFVEEPVILETIKTAPFETVAERLIDLANEAGGGDNITAIVVKVLELDDIPADDPLLQTLLKQSQTTMSEQSAGRTGTQPMPTMTRPLTETTAPVAASEEVAVPKREKSLTTWGCLGALFVIAALAGVLYWFDLPPVSFFTHNETATPIAATATLIQGPPTITIGPDSSAEPALTVTTVTETATPTELLEPTATP